MIISIPANTLFHTLTHFEGVTNAVYLQLKTEGYNDSEIQEQASKVGSKFFNSFADSAITALEILKGKFPNHFDNLQFDNDRRCRLSFVFPHEIGNCQVASLSDLTAYEKSTITESHRNGCIIRTAKSKREFRTSECQVVLSKTDSAELILLTIFPGMLAPPLPKIGEASNPFWETHVFVTPE